MLQMRWFRAFGLAAIALMMSLTLAAQGDLTAIQQKLNTHFRLTKITRDRFDIVSAGDVVEIQTPGMLMYSVDSPLPPSNTYKNGKIGQGWGGFGTDILIGMAAPEGQAAADYPHYQAVPGERFWITEIRAVKDGMVFQLYSDPYDEIRFYANLKIPFPDKNAVPSVDVAMQLVEKVLTSAPAGDPGRPMEAGNSSPPTIWLGDTMDQVTAVFGKAQKVTNSGNTVVFKYDNTKVIFTNGRVSDVE